MGQIITNREQNKFLIENNCYFEYMENIRKILEETNYSEDWICGEDDFFIASDFMWNFTPEGYDYWKRIYDKYLKLKKENEVNS